MIPLTVSSIEQSARTGRDNFNNAQQQFLSGFGSLGKNLSDGILTSRLIKEENDALDAKRLQEAIDKDDPEAMHKLTRGSILWPGNWGQFRMPENVDMDVMDVLREKANTRLAELKENGQSTARRAAERAGMATGYIPASEQDKLDFEAKTKAEAEAAKQQNQLEAMKMQREQKLVDDADANQRILLNLSNSQNTLTGQEKLSGIHSIAQITKQDPVDVAMQNISQEQIKGFVSDLDKMGNDPIVQSARQAANRVLSGNTSNLISDVSALVKLSVMSNLNIEPEDASKPEIQAKVNNSILNLASPEMVKSNAASLLTDEQKQLWQQANTQQRQQVQNPASQIGTYDKDPDLQNALDSNGIGIMNGITYVKVNGNYYNAQNGKQVEF